MFHCAIISRTASLWGATGAKPSSSSGVANLFQIACQHFQFEIQKHSRVPCTFFYNIQYNFTIRTYLMFKLNKINTTFSFVWQMIKVLFLENILYSSMLHKLHSRR